MKLYSFCKARQRLASNVTWIHTAFVIAVLGCWGPGAVCMGMPESRQQEKGRILLLFFSFCAVNNTSVRHRPGRGRKQFSARGIDWDADGRVRKGQKNMCIFRSSLNYSCTHKPAWCFVFKNACSNSQCKVFFFFFLMLSLFICIYFSVCMGIHPNTGIYKHMNIIK